MAYDKNGLKIVLNWERPSDDPDATLVSMVATNSTSSNLQDFRFEVRWFFFKLSLFLYGFA